jgi:pimeloyl-ACP methyl ester carboxylesterase
MIRTLWLFMLAIFIQACHDDNDGAKFKEKQADLSTHKLTSYAAIANSKYLVVFESGLGDDHQVWESKSVATQISSVSDVMMYDRAGYGKSTSGPAPRNIEKLRSELEVVVNLYGSQRKIVLVGHSLGGMIIRDYAIKNPDRVAALLFIDPSHEYYNQLTQETEDQIYNAFKSAYGATFGGTMEAREVIEDSQYTSTLPSLPNVPTIVLTSMKLDATHDAADRQRWFDAHEMLKEGVNDFTHITTTNSGHYIMKDEPSLVIEKLKTLLSKLP